jgi:outer membrane protein assembly factor BamB
MKSSLCLIQKQTASFRFVGLMLTITSLGLMLALANRSAQAQASADVSTTTASTPSETVLGVGNVVNLKLKWKAAGVSSQLFRTGMALPVVANGIVYGSLLENEPFALNASTGATLWDFSNPDGPFFASDGSPLSVANGLAYFGSENFVNTPDFNVYVLDAVTSTGALLWSFTPGAATALTFTVASGGVVYVGTGSSSSFTGPGTVDALNANNRAKLWSFAVDGFPWSSAVANGVVYVGTSSSLNGPFTGPAPWTR